MIEHHLDQENAILHIQPKSALQPQDFERLAEVVDPFISQTGGLAGLIIETPSFPGWESVGALCAHLRFVRGHHQDIRKVALVTDSVLGMIAEGMAAHFVSAEIKPFPSSSLDEARDWILEKEHV